MTTIIEQIKHASTGLQENKAKALETAFLPIIGGLKALEDEYNSFVSNDAMSEENSEEARVLRLKLSKVRVSADKIHKKEKQDFLLACRAIDGVRNIIKHQLVSKEEKLSEIETYYLVQKEKEVQGRGDQRLVELHNLETKWKVKLCDLPSVTELGLMDDTNWNRALKGADVEAKEIHEIEQQEKERQEKERQDEIFRQKERDRQFEIEKATRIESDKKLQEWEEKVKKYEDAAEKAGKELIQKKELEDSNRRAEEERERREKLAPDIEKVIQCLSKIRFAIYENNQTLHMIKNESWNQGISQYIDGVYSNICGYLDKLGDKP